MSEAPSDSVLLGSSIDQSTSWRAGVSVSAKLREMHPNLDRDEVKELIRDHLHMLGLWDALHDRAADN